MRKLMMTTALVSVVSLGAIAQTGDQTDIQTDAAEEPMRMLVPGFLVSDFTGTTLYTVEGGIADVGDATGRWTSSDNFAATRDLWESAGSISDVVMGEDGEIRGVLIDIGGFLGFFARTVMVDIDQLYFVADADAPEGRRDYFVVATLSREQFEELPEWSDAELQISFARRLTLTGDDTMPEPGIGDGMAAPDPLVPTEPGAETGDDIATEMDEMEQDGPTDGVADVDEPAPEGAVPEGFVIVDADEQAPDLLLGAPVHDATGEAVGSVEDVILSDDGTVAEVIIDIGGILGIGAHTVALPVEEAEILLNQSDDSLRVHVSLTRDELESLPEYQN